VLNNEANGSVEGTENCSEASGALRLSRDREV
jgi:hypothetical protein